MAKRPRGSPAGSEERRAKRWRRELRQLQQFTFAEVKHMCQDGHRTWTVKPEILAAKRFATVT